MLHDTPFFSSNNVKQYFLSILWKNIFRFFFVAIFSFWGMVDFPLIANLIQKRLQVIPDNQLATGIQWRIDRGLEAP